METFRKKYPQEKVHLHFDKPYYSVGDTIFFTAYVVNAEKNTPSVISNILYVDLINDSNKISETIKLPVADGIAAGTIEIADSLREGNYEIRAYTNWMRNFDDAFFFRKIIPVGNALTNDIVINSSFVLDAGGAKNRDSFFLQYTSLNRFAMEGKEVAYSVIINKKQTAKGKAVTGKDGKLGISLADLHLPENQNATLFTHIKADGKTTITKEVKINLPSSKYKVQFFPEGGQLVAALPCRVGFKALGEDGAGLDIGGEVKDDSTNETVSFQSGFKGIGSFIFTPKVNHTYHAFVKDKNGIEETALLPNIQANGCVLSVINTDKNKVDVHIASAGENNLHNLILIAQSGNRIRYAMPVSLIDGSATVTISKVKFPTGIAQFTLFDTALQPIAERLVFINHRDELLIGITPDKPTYNKREKTRLQLMVKDAEGNPVAGTFSLSVTDAGAVIIDEAKEVTILSDLLLSSDIKGYIEEPNHYFMNAEKTETELDNLLLTQGWRRFIWRDVLTEAYPPPSFTKEKSLVVSGTVVSAKGEPVAGSRVTLLPKSGDGFILDTTTNLDGKFMFDELNFTSNTPFVVQAGKTNTNKNVRVEISSFSTPPLAGETNRFYETRMPGNVMLSYLTHSRQQYDEMKKNGLLNNPHILKEVVVSTQQLTKVQEAVAPSMNLNGPGHADQILTYADLSYCHDLDACLQGKITGVYFKMVVEDPQAHTKTFHLLPFSTIGMGRPMLVVIDGTEILPGGGGLDIRNIPVQNIQSIEVLRSGGYTAIYGFNGEGGVLVITTKRGGIDYNAVYETKPKKPVENVVFTEAKGYSACRRFYMPDYNISAQRNATIPDLRSTIFWQPVITTGEDGKATVEYYNADNAGSCNIVVEGLSAEGKLGRAAFTYQIK